MRCCTKKLALIAGILGHPIVGGAGYIVTMRYQSSMQRSIGGVSVKVEPCIRHTQFLARLQR